MKQIMMSDPASQELMEKNPDIATILTDPEILQKVRRGGGAREKN
jgi:hypothetical protein